MRQKARRDVSYSHLNKHSLINSLEGWIDETGLWDRNTRTGLPPKSSPKLPESDPGIGDGTGDGIKEHHCQGDTGKHIRAFSGIGQQEDGREEKPAARTDQGAKSADEDAKSG